MAGIALAAGLTAYFAYFLWAFKYLPGTDAYYYALQAQSLLDNGHLKVPDHGAIHYAVATVARLGVSIETALRTILIVVFALYQLGMASLVQRLRLQFRASAALLWVLASPLIMFHAIEFPSLTLGLATVPFWFGLAIETTRRRIFALAALLSVSLLSHPAAAVLVLLFAAGIAAGNLHWRRPNTGKHALQSAALVGAACMTGLIVVVMRFAGLNLRIASFRLGMPGMFGLATAEVPNEIRFAAVTLWLLLFLLLVISRKNFPRRWLFLTLAALALPLFPNRETGLESVGGRLALMFILLALPLLAVVGSERTQARELPLRAWTPWLHRSLGLAVVIAVALLPVRLQSFRGLLMMDDYPAYENVVEALHDVPIPMLIAHRGLDFFYSYRLRRDAFHFDPEPDWNQAEIWRVAARITPEELSYYSPHECGWGQTGTLVQGTQYLLVREDCWEKFRTNLNRSDNPDLYAEVWENMENPSQARPAFLRARRALSVVPISGQAPR